MDLSLTIVIIAVLTGYVAVLTGIGGGVLLVPALTYLFHIPIHTAVATSVTAIIATSLIGSYKFLQARLTNLEVGLTLEVLMAAGAFLGSLLSIHLGAGALSWVFGLLLLVSATSMIFEKKGQANQGKTRQNPTRDPGGDYEVSNMPVGIASSFVAGGLAGLLGIGGGVVQIPVMTLLMKLPIKEAVATSNFMVGITATSAVFVYFFEGYVSLILTGQVVLGVVIGGYLGAASVTRVNGGLIRRFLAVLLFSIGVLTLYRA